MADVLVFLTFLALILLIGLLTSIVSNKIRIPQILLLVLVGILLGKMTILGEPVIFFPELFFTAISILALVMIVFDSASRFTLRSLDYFSLHTLWLSVVFLIFNMVLLSMFTMALFGVSSIFLALAFAALMSGTDPGAVLSMFKNTKHKVVDFLRLEALLNTPLVVLMPFIILDLQETVKGQLFLATFLQQIVPFLQQIIAGIGTGVLIGLLMFKFMRKQYSAVLSPLAVITAALLTYTIAENLGGNGVLAVTTMGLLFGSVYVKHKIQLQEFSLVFSNALEILVFILIGIVTFVPFTFDFFVKSIILFILYLGIRLLSIVFSLRGMHFTFREQVFMTLNVQKGIAVAVVVLALAPIAVSGIDIILNLALTFMIYSILLSSVVIRFAPKFIQLCKN